MLGGRRVRNQMPILPVPNRCIWCQRQAPDVSFNINHVLPECVGNERQQILPTGIVCEECNQYFGAKIEPALLDDPFFHVIAVALSLVDPDDMNVFRARIFDATHPPVEPVNRALDVHALLKGQEVNLDVSYTIRGRISRQYSPRNLAALSRAVHKIAFESLAWVLYVKGIETPFDPFSAQFHAVREWARKGRPRSSVRPVLRRMGEISHQWEHRIRRFGQELGIELNLFGDWYGVNLTSPHSQALSNLQVWAGQEANGVWYIGNSLSILSNP